MSRAVSHVVGFVLVFAVVTTSIGVLYGSGVGSLEGARDVERVDNAERAVVALAQNFEAVDRGRAPGRAGEVRLGGGSLGVDETTEFRIAVVRDGTTVVQRNLSAGALVYEYDDTAIRYENGGVFRENDGGSVLVRPPAFDCTDRALVSTVSVRPGPDTGTVTKDGTVVVVGRRTNASMVFPQNATVQADGENVTVRFEVVSSANSEAWDRYLTGEGWSRSGDWYECTADRAFVRQTVLDVAIRT